MPVFGFLIACISCLEGPSGSAQSGREHTTSGIVQSIFVVTPACYATTLPDPTKFNKLS
ncbi:ABC transporter permease [Paraburkholderia sp. BCC1885]|uniref:ABC transporter permease n=1 Tax=Paraburkholderia sp. BCC1885 TaxID=2562669 RepID=UPI001C921D4D